MKPRWLIRLAWVLWGFVVATLAVDTLVAVADWSGTVAHGGIFVFVAFMGFVVAFSTVGVLIAVRQPGNPIGWLLLACAVGYALAGLAESYASYGQLTRPNVLPGVTLAAWAASWLFLTGAGPAATFLLLLLPHREASLPALEGGRVARRCRHGLDRGHQRVGTRPDRR